MIPERGLYRFDPAAFGWTLDAPSEVIRSPSEGRYHIIVNDDKVDSYNVIQFFGRARGEPTQAWLCQIQG